MYFYNNNNDITLPFDNSVDINDIKSVFVLYDKKKIGFYRNGNFFIDNFTIDLKINVINYDMSIIKSKTIRHDITNNRDQIYSYNIGYELKSNNEYYSYVIKILNDQVFLYAKKNINNQIEEKHIALL